jgi:hypothetical protein
MELEGSLLCSQGLATIGKLNAHQMNALIMQTGCC